VLPPSRNRSPTDTPFSSSLGTHTIIPAFYPKPELRRGARFFCGYSARQFAERGWLLRRPAVSRPFTSSLPPQAKPGSFNVSGGGVGTGNHMSAERFRASGGIEALYVPFPGGPEAMSEVMAGRLDFSLLPVGLVLPHLRDGKLRALAVNSTTRSAALPDVPTLAGWLRGCGLRPLVWDVSSAKSPREIVEKLHRETVHALQIPKVQEKLMMIGVEPMAMSPADFDARVREEIGINAALIKAAG